MSEAHDFGAACAECDRLRGRLAAARERNDDLMRKLADVCDELVIAREALKAKRDGEGGGLVR